MTSGFVYCISEGIVLICPFRDFLSKENRINTTLQFDIIDVSFLILLTSMIFLENRTVQIYCMVLFVSIISRLSSIWAATT
jgi:hypothetical protein